MTTPLIQQLRADARRLVQELNVLADCYLCSTHEQYLAAYKRVQAELDETLRRFHALNTEA